MNLVNLSVAKKFGKALRQSQFDCVLIAGSDHLNYLSGASLPFLGQASNQLERMVILIWDKREDPVILCPSEWESTLRHLSWIKRIVGYPAFTPKGDRTDFLLPTQIIRGFKLFGRKRWVGIDMNRAPHPFVEHLQGSFSDTAFVGCEDWLREIRALKTAEEIELLEEVAYRTDHGILGASHHVLTTAWRPEKGLSEIIRVHCLERGLDAVGYHSVSQGVSGKNAEKYWPLAPRFGVGGGKTLAAGEMVRLEMRASLHGYWSDSSRMLIMGEPSTKQIDAYDKLVVLRETLIKNLRPGTTCRSVFEAVKKVARQKKIDLLSGSGVGHGIGVSVFEAPYLNSGDPTEIRERMVLVLDPVIRGPNHEIMRSKDTVVITEKGCKIIGWYKDWREPYIALNSHQHGGG
jgi:Xaa-Pro aminopeptidase